MQKLEQQKNLLDKQNSNDIQTTLANNITQHNA